MLGLLIWYMKPKRRQYNIFPVVGPALTSISVWVDYVLEVMYRICLANIFLALWVFWLPMDKTKESAALLENNCPTGSKLCTISALVDGTCLRCANYINSDIQSEYWEGYKRSVKVTNKLVYNFKEEIIHDVMNYSGCLHDSKLTHLTGLILPKLSEVMKQPGMNILGDSTFFWTAKLGAARWPKLAKRIKILEGVKVRNLPLWT